MKSVFRYFIGACCLTLMAGSINVMAAGDDVKAALSKDITTLYRSARAVISANQALINDASKGNKGLTGEKVIAHAKENYKKATGHSLNENTGNGLQDEATQAMLKAVQQTMDESQDLINEKGKGFKGFLPAIFAKLVADRFSKNMGNKMTIKLTAPKELVRNRANRPDKWESNIINSSFKSSGYEKGKPFFENTEVKGSPAFRYILPEYYGATCLGCHGGPKGELDITGGKKEGGKLGDLGGAISLVINES